jgi:hypothetical protein
LAARSLLYDLVGGAVQRGAYFERTTFERERCRWPQREQLWITPYITLRGARPQAACLAPFSAHQRNCSSAIFGKSGTPCEVSTSTTITSFSGMAVSETFLTVTEQTDRKGELVFFQASRSGPHQRRAFGGDVSDYQGSRLLHAGKKTVKWFSGWTGR